MPLRPAGGVPTRQENRELGRAFEVFAASRSLRQLEEFAARYPQSPRRASLLINLGKLRWQEGYFSRAAATWDEAWQLTKDSTERGGRDLVDIALSEWLTGAMTFGQVDKLQQKLDEIGRRPIGGPAGNKVTEAREGLWQLTNYHEMATYSGPEALKNLLSVTGKSNPREITQVDAYQPAHEGTSPRGTLVHRAYSGSRRRGAARISPLRIKRAAAVIGHDQVQRRTPASAAAARRGPSLQPNMSLRRTANSRCAASYTDNWCGRPTLTVTRTRAPTSRDQLVREVHEAISPTCRSSSASFRRRTRTMSALATSSGHSAGTSRVAPSAMASNIAAVCFVARRVHARDRH